MDDTKLLEGNIIKLQLEINNIHKRTVALEAEEKLAKARGRQLWAMLEAANIEIQRLKRGATNE